MSAYTNEQELNEGLSIVEAEERLEMVQTAIEVDGISCCGDSGGVVAA